MVMVRYQTIPSRYALLVIYRLKMQAQSSESMRVNAIFVEARQKFQKYGQGPRPEDLFDSFQWTMSNVYVFVSFA
jgi:hypothetical protein